MKNLAKSALVLAILCVTGRECFAVEPVRLDLSAGARKMSGITDYQILMSGYASDGTTIVSYESKLEFPLEMYLVGAEGRLTGTMIPWSAGLSVYTNTGTSGGVMTDRDWFGVPAGNYRFEFSNTTSDAPAKAFVLDLNGRFRVYAQNATSLDLLLGYMYEKFSFEVTGVRGWQDPGTGRTYFDLYQGVNVADYEVTYGLPYAGLSLANEISESATLRGHVSVSPASVSDRDDHILRKKISTAHARGIGIRGGVDLAATLAGPQNGPSWYLLLGVEATKIETSGEQTQEWYGNDPAGAGDETGMKISGIEDHITSSQTVIRASVGMRF